MGLKQKASLTRYWIYQLPQNEHYVAYVGEYGASQLHDMLSTIDCSTRTIINREELPDTPHGISATQDGRKVLLSLYYSGTVVKFDTTDSNVVSYFDVPGASNSTISPDGEFFYVSSNSLSAKVTRIRVENDDYKIISMENFELGYTPAIMPNDQSVCRRLDGTHQTTAVLSPTSKTFGVTLQRLSQCRSRPILL